MSFKPLVQTTSDPKFYDNAQRFATYDEAMLSAKHIMSRWMLVVDIDVQESTDPVNYQIINSVISPI